MPVMLLCTQCLYAGTCSSILSLSYVLLGNHYTLAQVGYPTSTLNDQQFQNHFSFDTGYQVTVYLNTEHAELYVVHSCGQCKTKLVDVNPTTQGL